MKTIVFFIRNALRQGFLCCGAAAALVAALPFLASCGDSDDDKDMTAPVIATHGITPNPVNCQVYHPGDTIFFSYLFEDNQELGNFNIEVHGNFDHHSHSTESDDHDHEGGGECNHDGHDHDGDHGEEGTAWVYNQTFTLPTGQHSYNAKTEIPVPKNAKHGDYHFMIRLTDRAGWQQLKAVAIIIE